MSDLFTIRPMRLTDLPYVGRTYIRNWSKAWQHSHEGEERRIPYQAFTESVQATWRRWEREASGIVAASTQDPDLILGWAIHEGDVLHYVHVRKTVRRSGIGMALLEGLNAVECYTHRTPQFMGLLNACGWTPYYDPFRAYLSPELYHDRRSTPEAEIYEEHPVFAGG